MYLYAVYRYVYMNAHLSLARILNYKKNNNYYDIVYTRRAYYYHLYRRNDSFERR